MTINWKLLENEEIKKELLNIINDDEKFNKILVDTDGEDNAYVLDDEKFAAFASVGVAATCYDENEARSLARNIIEFNIEEIAEWIPKRNFVLRLDAIFGHSIGKRSNGETTIDQKGLRITLRKSINDTTEYGFYVSGIIPYTA